MIDLLTTRQLQDLLQVDRVTIYRMLSDGRLPGFKVGGQWRFSRQEIEEWLAGQRTTLEAGGFDRQQEDAPSPLPLSCAEAIQSVYAEVLGVAAVTTEPDGSPLTEISNSCQFCNLILSTEEGRERCAASWRVPETKPGATPAVRTCHAGLRCVSAPILVEGQWQASVASCQFVAAAPQGQEETWLTNLPVLADELGLREDNLRAAAGGVERLTDDQISRIAHLLQRVADTFCEIGQERSKLLSRLERIAEMTHI
jgi:excisionase family DNA binding protein